MNQTQNLHLPQWEADDRIMRTDFNEAMSKLDTALKAANDAVAAKADAAALAQKADASALTALDTRVGALETDVATRSRFVKLRDITLSQNQTELSVDVSDIDWSQWQRLHLDISMNNGSQVTLSGVAGVSSVTLAYLSSTWSNPAFQKAQDRLTLNPGCWPERFVEGWTGNNTNARNTTVKYKDLTAFTIGTGETLYAGGKFILWGEA